MNDLEDFKLKYLRQLSDVSSFEKAWAVWKPSIESKIKHSRDSGSLFDLGDCLSEIFKTTRVSGRDQGTLSGGGTAWECLVTWYLNLIFWGTHVIVVRQNIRFVPECISNCVTVTIANNQTNTESDLLIFSVPDHGFFSGDNVYDLNNFLKAKLSQIDLVVLQCKTNWNDNSQIPMLWDMIYNSESRLSNVSVGINGVNPQALKNFSYGFVTVPTNKSEKMKPSSVSVLRVKNLTGGNYWGMPTTPDIAASLKEFPGRHFPDKFEGGVKGHIQKQIERKPSFIDQFIELSF